MPLTAAQGNLTGNSAQLGTPNGKLTNRKLVGASPRLGGTPLLHSGARIETAALQARRLSIAEPLSPALTGAKSLTPRLGGGARRVSTLEESVSTPVREQATRPSMSPFERIPSPQAGDFLAFGTPKSVFRQPPRRVLPEEVEQIDRSPFSPTPSSLGSCASPLNELARSEGESHASRGENAAEKCMASECTLHPRTPLSNVLRSGPRRVATASRTHRSSPVPMSPGLALNTAGTHNSGTIVQLVHARASAAQQAKTGSSRVVTPARRSTRVAAASLASTTQLLEQTNFAYAPNAALQRMRDDVAEEGASEEFPEAASPWLEESNPDAREAHTRSSPGPEKPHSAASTRSTRARAASHRCI